MSRVSAPLPPAFSAAKVRKQMLPISLQQALADAAAAGFRQTARSRPDAAYVQRAWNAAATIRPVPGGVVIAPAWTTAQIAVVVVVLVLLCVGTVGIPGLPRA